MLCALHSLSALHNNYKSYVYIDVHEVIGEYLHSNSRATAKPHGARQPRTCYVEEIKAALAGPGWVGETGVEVTFGASCFLVPW